MDYAKFDAISIRNHSALNELWVQDCIAEDPSILGLGQLILRDRERRQPRAGRLDLLLQERGVPSTIRGGNPVRRDGREPYNTDHRVLGYRTEEVSPVRQHTAVIVAEDITSRFLNVISLFNGMIPLVAIQMKAITLDNKVGLIFTTVLDQMTFGFIEDEEDQEITDRAYWESRGTKETLAMADKLFEFARVHDSSLEMKYKQDVISVSQRMVKFSIFLLHAHVNLLSDSMSTLSISLSYRNASRATGLDVMDFDNRWRNYRIRLQPGDIEKHKEIIEEIIAMAYEAAKE